MTPDDLKSFLAQIRKLRRSSKSEGVRKHCELVISNITLLLGARRGDKDLEARLRRNAAGLERAVLGKRPDDDPPLLNWRTYLERDQSGRSAAP